MKQDIKELWIRALRSGDYHQGRGNLRYGKLHCCLGVLADLLHPDEWRGNSMMGMGQTLSAEILEEAGLLCSEQGRLWIMNDSRDPFYSFDDIAHYIETNL